MRLPFDRIEIEHPSGKRDITLDELRALSLRERVRMILDGRITFWAAGERVASTVALKSLARASRTGDYGS